MERPLATRSPESPSAAGPDAPTLRCQWCDTALAPSVTACPRCGSAGIPDPRLTMPDDAPAAFAAPAEPAEPAEQSELVEWWREDDAPDAPRRQQLSMADVERRRVQTFAAMGGGVVVCIALGWLAGPLLAPALERLTGSPVEHPEDLRGMGAFLGFLVGMFFGATSGWIIWSGK